MTNGELFGTDGARGVFEHSNVPGMANSATYQGLAMAMVESIQERENETRPIVIVGGDTRDSSPELRSAAISGAVQAGADVWNVGVAPTPTIAWLAQKYNVAAISITASHNDAEYNGFKPFEIGGSKPDKPVLQDVERRFWENASGPRLSRRFGTVTRRNELAGFYLKHLVRKLGGPETLRGSLVALDGANGAAWNLAPRLFRRLGAEVVEFACDLKAPINRDTGAAHLHGIRGFMASQPGLDLHNNDNFLGAFSFDGDADRVMGTTTEGDAVDGNYWLRFLAGAPGQKGVVGTVYTNTAAREAVRSLGVDFHESDNGDSNVTAMLRSLTRQHGEGYNDGSEVSGHHVRLTHLPSGDGLYMAGLMAVHLAQEGITLSDVRRSMTLWPEKSINIPTGGADGKAVAALETVEVAKNSELERYDNQLRFVIRASGTEPLVRVWAEAPEPGVAESAAGRVGKLIGQLLLTYQQVRVSA